MARPISRSEVESVRMTMPLAVMSISSSASVTLLRATTLPLRSVVLMLMTPLPPRRVLRYSSTCVRLP